MHHSFKEIPEINVRVDLMGESTDAKNANKKNKTK